MRLTNVNVSVSSDSTALFDPGHCITRGSDGQLLNKLLTGARVVVCIRGPSDVFQMLLCRREMRPNSTDNHVKNKVIGGWAYGVIKQIFNKSVKNLSPHGLSPESCLQIDPPPPCSSSPFPPHQKQTGSASACQEISHELWSLSLSLICHVAVLYINYSSSPS